MGVKRRNEANHLRYPTKIVFMAKKWNFLFLDFSFVFFRISFVYFMWLEGPLNHQISSWNFLWYLISYIVMGKPVCWILKITFWKSDPPYPSPLLGNILQVLYVSSSFIQASRSWLVTFQLNLTTLNKLKQITCTINNTGIIVWPILGQFIT